MPTLRGKQGQNDVRGACVYTEVFEAIMFPRSPKRSGRSFPRPFRPRFESLECRCLMDGSAVLYWNAVALDAVKNDAAIGIAPDQSGPSASARALAIVHVAIYDAVMAIDHRYVPYLYHSAATHRMSMDAAIGQAAHDTLSALYPQQEPLFDAALAQAMAGKPQSQVASGLEMGGKVAKAMMAARADDGAVANMSFTPGTLPGEWRPDPLHPNQIAWGPNWGDVEPFVMDTSADFAVPPVPALTSQAYTAAYNEVKALGGDGVHTPTTRTPEQTVIGIFWGYDGTPGLGTPPRIYNQATRVIAQKMHNSEIDNARLFALVNLALADAGIASWDTKYLENFWRPVTAIRESDPGTGPTGLGDGNPNTIGDPGWTPLGAPNDNGGGTNFTPPFPAYTSGHATFGAAAFGAIRRFYGTDKISFTLGSDEFNGVTRDQNGQVRPVITRNFSSLSQAVEENAISRIYLGIHWRFDATAGIAQGTAIANYVADHFGLRKPLFGNGLPSGIGHAIHQSLAGLRSSLDAARAALEQAFSHLGFLDNLLHIAQTTSPSAQPTKLLQVASTSGSAKPANPLTISLRDPAPSPFGLQSTPTIASLSLKKLPPAIGASVRR